MRLVFVHDHVFKRCGDRVYSHQFPHSILERYLAVFSDLTVVARVCDVQEPEDAPVSSGPGVEFVFLESISHARSFTGLRKKHKEVLRQQFVDRPAVVARLPSELGMLAIAVAKHCGIPYSVEVVGCGWDSMWYHGSVAARLYAPISYWRMRKSVRNAKSILYVTGQFLQSRYPGDRKSSIGSASNVEIPNLVTSATRSRRSTVACPGRQLRLCTIASMHNRYKGIHVALTALAELHESFTSFEYHVAGAGDISRYSKLAEDLGIGGKVTFHGGLPRAKVFDLLEETDIYIQPSLTEGLPRALIEAMGHGCPAVATRVGGIPELIDDDLLFSPRNPGELAEIIGFLIENPRVMLDQGERNQRKTRRYQRDVVSKARSEFYAGYRNSLLPKAEAH